MNCWWEEGNEDRNPSTSSSSSTSYGRNGTHAGWWWVGGALCVFIDRDDRPGCFYIYLFSAAGRINRKERRGCCMCRGRCRPTWTGAWSFARHRFSSRLPSRNTVRGRRREQKKTKEKRYLCGGGGDECQKIKQQNKRELNRVVHPARAAGLIDQLAI